MDRSSPNRPISKRRRGLRCDADGLARFTGALADYARYDLVRIGAWVVFDGLVPLGPDFVQKIVGTWKDLASNDVAGNAAFKALAGKLPGDSMDDKRGFAIQALDKTGEWVTRFVEDKQLTQQGALQSLQGALKVADGGLDYVAARAARARQREADPRQVFLDYVAGAADVEPDPEDRLESEDRR